MQREIERYQKRLRGNERQREVDKERVRQREYGKTRQLA